MASLSLDEPSHMFPSLSTLPGFTAGGWWLVAGCSSAVMSAERSDGGDMITVENSRDGPVVFYQDLPEGQEEEGK